MKAASVGAAQNPNRWRLWQSGNTGFGLIRAVALACALGAPHFVGATGGAVDQAGCHDSKKQGFHCHPERAQGAAGGGAFNSSQDRSQAERDKRLKRECKGRPNAGACLGYTS